MLNDAGLLSLQLYSLSEVADQKFFSSILKTEVKVLEHGTLLHYIFGERKGRHC